MKSKTPHNIICLEAEWLFNSARRENRFNLKTEFLLNWLREFHQCEIIYRHILYKADLKYYLEYFKRNKSVAKNHDIIYIACHGESTKIHLEDGDIDLDELADMADGFFEGRLIHFSSCKTLSKPEVAERFKKKTKAKLVSGYTKPVDVMKSALADIALFNDLMYITTRIGIITNKESSTFRRTYNSLLEELGFEAY